MRTQKRPSDSPMDTIDANHALDLVKTLNQNRSQIHLTDFTIILNETHQFHCHGSILAVYSRYFQAMLYPQHDSANFEENANRICRINEGFIRPEILGKVLDWVYTGEIEIEWSNDECNENQVQQHGVSGFFFHMTISSLIVIILTNKSNHLDTYADLTK